jgi:pimeloyl-ACP methyl ester carboxylesterase
MSGPVIFYDQLGCGRSSRPEGASLFTAEHYVAELAAVRQAMGLDRLHILGQSWGTMLACEYLLPAGEMAVLHNASHLHHLEQPFIFRAILREFLHRHEE